MAEEAAKNGNGLSRREFIKDAGLVMGGVAIGSLALTASCGSETTVTKTVSSYACPYCTQTFASLDLLKTHVSASHAASGAVGLEDMVRLNVNGDDYYVKVEPYWDLAFVLRDKLGFFALKIGCSLGECGACTIVINGRSVYACMVLACEANGAKIETVEGLSDGITMHPIQTTILQHNAAQCGYCTPGFMMSTKALLAKKAKPSYEEVREALSGHVCMCGELKRLVDAIYEGAK